MAEGNGQRREYSVRTSGQLAEQVKAHYRDARLHGRSAAFLSAMRTIYERLVADPFGLGEPLYRLPALHLQVRQFVMAPAVVNYAVHEDRPLVILQAVELMDPP